MEALFDIHLPKYWVDLTDEQLTYFYAQLATQLPFDMILPLCLFHWARLKVVRFAGDKFVIRKRHSRQEITVTPQDLQPVVATLDYLRRFPRMPVCIKRIGRAWAVPMSFMGVPFGTFIAVDNYYQGFLHTYNYDLLREAALLLYPKVRRKSLTTAHLLNIFYWITSLKQSFAQQFPHFFTSAPSSSDNLLGSSDNLYASFRAATNAQIRALTGGDITKEQAVLDMDTWRALTELDAKADETERIKKKYNQK